MSQTHLYRHFNSAGVLLYVGVSCNALTRTSQHKHNAEWFSEIANITIETFDSRSKALEAEIKAIRKEKPKFNIAGVEKSNHSESSITKEPGENYSIKISFGRWFVKVVITTPKQPISSIDLGKPTVDCKWLSVTDSAKVAGVSRRTIQRYMRAEKISSKIDEKGNPKINKRELVKVFPCLKAAA